MYKSDKLDWVYWSRVNNVQKYEHDLWAKQTHGMHGGWHTRQRMASTPSGDNLGRWERISKLSPRLSWSGFIRLKSWLPPECVPTGELKIRAHRSDITLADIIDAAEPQQGKSLVHWEDIQPLLDAPADRIITLATMNRMLRLV